MARHGRSYILPGVERKHVPLFLLCVGGPLAVYVYSAAPGVTLVDAGELALACRTLGIAHPPGFPLYVLLGHAFSYLPLAGDVARRLNLFSAACAALAAGVAFLLCRQLLSLARAGHAPRDSKALGRQAERAKTRAERQERLRAPAARAQSQVEPREQKGEASLRQQWSALPPEWAAVAAALAFGFSLSLWSWATVTEVYALNILLVALVLWLAACGDWHKAALMAGLALCVHHATAALALPAAFYLLWTGRRPKRREWLAIAALSAAGLLLYLYLPLRAAQSPLLNWGDPSTLQRFRWQVTGRQYQAQLLRASVADVTWALGYFLGLWLRQFTPVGFLLGAWGLFALFRRSRRLFWFTLILVALNAGFTLSYDVREDVEGYYLPTFLAWAWCFAFGVEALSTVRLFQPGGFPRKALSVGLAAAAILPAVVHFGSNNLRRDRIAPLFVENTLRGALPGALILTSEWDFYSPWLYRRYVEGFRPDVAVINTLLLRCSWYLDFVERGYPDLARAAAPEFAAYRRELAALRPLRPCSTETGGAFVALVDAMARARVSSGASVSFTWTIERPVIESPFLGNLSVEPQGLLHTHLPGTPRPPEAGPEVELDLAGLADGTVPMDLARQEVRRTYASMLAARANHLLRSGARDAARARAEAALRLEPDLPLARQLLSGLP